jgi:hypothetical protein
VDLTGWCEPARERQRADGQDRLAGGQPPAGAHRHDAASVDMKLDPVPRSTPARAHASWRSIAAVLTWAGGATSGRTGNAAPLCTRDRFDARTRALCTRDPA